MLPSFFIHLRRHVQAGGTVLCIVGKRPLREVLLQQPQLCRLQSAASWWMQAVLQLKSERERVSESKEI